MTTGLIVAMILAVGIGLTLGLLGGGGTILAVPLLTYVAGMPPQEAITSSMFIIGVTALTSVWTHAKRGNVHWRTGLIFGTASMVGAFCGGLVGSQLPGVVLMVAFSLMMLATALSMILGRRGGRSPQSRTKLPVVKIVVEGLVVGAVTGMVGAGGGFLVVPALVLLSGLSMSTAVGTSLLIIALKSFTGMAGYLTTVNIDWVPVLIITGITVVGALMGATLSRHVPERALKTAFGYFVLAMGIFVLLQELPPIFGISAGVALGIPLTVLKFRKRHRQIASANTNSTEANRAREYPLQRRTG